MRKADASVQVVIPHVSRNNELLRRNAPYLRDNLDHSSIVVLTDGGNVPELSRWLGDEFLVLDEDAIFPGLTHRAVETAFSGTAVPARRAGWYYQQFLKMAWAFHGSCADWYVVWDSDTFPLRRLRLFGESGEPLFSMSHEHNPVYFETLDRLLGLKRQAERSFVAENMLIKKAIMAELVDAINAKAELGGGAFFEKILAAVKLSSDPYRAFSEFETYGTYAMARHPGLYGEIVRLSTRKGARRFGLKPSRYDLARLSRRFEIASFESWDRIVPPLISLNKLVSLVVYPFIKATRA